MSISRDALVAALGSQANSLDVQVFEQIDSTNAWLAANPPARDALVVASTQTAGRGRQGRIWQSPSGGIYFSLGRPAVDAASASSPILSLAIAVAMTETLSSFGLVDVRVKWPNDLVVKGAKLAGILVENVRKTLIAGVGLNWSETAISQLPNDRQAVGIASLIGPPHLPSLEQFCASLALAVLATLRLSPQALADWVAAGWPRWDALANRVISVQQGNGPVVTGTALGITAEGALRLRTAHGEQTLHSGETRIQGGWER